nr:DUF4198 domain-containing protein [uncultured Desulfobulbus sp.]
MHRMTTLLFQTLFFLVTLGLSVAQAHYLWLNADDYRPKEKGIPLFSVGWGHNFYSPVGDILTDPEMLAQIDLIDPAGKKMTMDRINGFQYQAHHQYGPGVYLASTAIKERFSTKTKEGYKHQSKIGLSDVLSSRYLGMYAKAIINVGEASEAANLSTPLGTPLELVPLTNPASLQPGDFFRFSLLYQGKPLAEEVNATYAGFSPHNAWPYTCRTDKDGVGAIRILQPGIWVIKVNYRAPYPNLEEADEYSYTASLTFEVR